MRQLVCQDVQHGITTVPNTNTKLSNAVTDVNESMQDATEETDIQVQILPASLGGQVDGPEGQSISIWEAIAGLRTSGSCTTGISNDNFHYLDKLGASKLGDKIGKHGCKLH